MLIPTSRFYPAAERLARRRLCNQILAGLLADYPMADPYLFDLLLVGAFRPWVRITLANRLWARGHIIMDDQTREILRGRQ